MSIEELQKIGTAIDVFFEKVSRRKRSLANLRKLTTANMRKLSPAVREWMKLMIRELQKGLAKVKVREAGLAVSRLADWKYIREQGEIILKPALLSILAAGGDAVVRRRIIKQERFDPIGAEAVKWASEHTAELVVGITGETMDAIRSYVTAGINAGKSIPRLASELRPLVGLAEKQIMAVANYHEKLILERPEYTAARQRAMAETYAKRLHGKRALLIARTETRNALWEGVFQGYGQMGIKKVEGVSGPDACDWCIDNIDGKVYTIDVARSVASEAHPGCYAEGTEVYTDKGWKAFKDIDGEETILSFNPADLNMEWTPIRANIAYRYEGSMYELKSRWFDLLITPNHSQVYGHRCYQGKKEELVWRIKPMEDLADSYNLIIPRTARWRGKELEEIEINGVKFDTSIFCKFMGFWLSEGHVTKRSENCYQIVITQWSDKMDGIHSDLRDFPLKIDKGENHLYIFSKELGAYLQQFGKSAHKFIPKEIKDLNTKYIREFLSAFAVGDGHYRRIKRRIEKSGSYINSDELVFFTSSKKLSDDLGELILKSGGYPSFRVREDAGKWVKFKNGTYKINNDLFAISWNTSEKAYFGRGAKNSIKEKKYNGRVYDVSLPKNHILWVRYRGKTCLSCNCECAWVATT